MQVKSISVYAEHILCTHECSFPFHVLLADAVESNGGSVQLSKILNRIGAVASSDTLNRVILSVLQERKKQGIQSLLVSEAFTVASTDNIDFLQSHAAVYSGNQLCIGTLPAFN